MAMKERVLRNALAVILSCVLMIISFSVTVFADDSYGLWVDGIEVTAGNAGNILGNDTASYNAETQTLTLSGASITKSYERLAVSAGISAEGNLNIVLNGDNSINVENTGITAGIYANGIITISGSGLLNVSASSSGGETWAIAAGYTANEAGVVINSGTITVTATGGSSSYAVYVDGSYGSTLPERYFKINGGMVELNATSASNGDYYRWATNSKPDFSGYEGYSATAILNSWEEIRAYEESSWDYYRYIKVQPLVYDDNGISEDKEHYQPAQLVDGYYEIANAGNLYWFAQKLAESEDNTALNARLVSNITMPEGMNWKAMGVGTYGSPYQGTFDGQDYTISNLSAKSDSMAGVFNNEGLFKTTGNDGVVKDLGMINASVKPDSGYAGAICGTNYGRIKDCYNIGGEISAVSMYAGGIAGQNNGTIERCYNTGTVSSVYGYAIGGIAGYATTGSMISDCYNTGDISGYWYIGGICGQLDGGTVKNCYSTGSVEAQPPYTSTAHPIVGNRINSYTVENTYYVNDSENNDGGRTAEQFAYGEVAWLLNGESSSGAWGQTIGTESAPVLGGAAVYEGYEFCYSTDVSYSNDSTKVFVEKPEHAFTVRQYNADGHWYACANESCTATTTREDHSFTNYVSDHNATCTGDGTKTAKCDDCNQTHTLTDEGSATGHHFVLPEGNGDYYICENCGMRGAIITKVPVINPEEPVEEIQVGVDSGSNSVINSEVTSLIDSALKGEAVSSVSEDVAESIVTAVENNEDITTEVVFDNNVSIDDAERELVENSVPTADGIEYFDLSIVIKSVSRDGSEKVLGNIRRISEMMTFTVAIPDDMIRENREFYIVRVHDGVAERLDTTMNADNTLTFQTDRFSTYAIAYTDKQ